MESIEFTEKGFWYNIYKLNYGDVSMPLDTCTYRRGIIISFITALLLLPLTILRVLWRLMCSILYFNGRELFITNDGWGGYLASLAFIIFPLIFGAGVFSEILKGSSLFIIWVYGTSLIVGALGSLGFLLIICYFIKEIYDKWRDNKVLSYKVKPDSKFMVLYKSWKDKYCKRIIWK